MTFPNDTALLRLEARYDAALEALTFALDIGEQQARHARILVLEETQSKPQYTPFHAASVEDARQRVAAIEAEAVAMHVSTRSAMVMEVLP